jgi:hypothetical protein
MANAIRLLCVCHRFAMALAWQIFWFSEGRSRVLELFRVSVAYPEGLSLSGGKTMAFAIALPCVCYAVGMANG